MSTPSTDVGLKLQIATGGLMRCCIDTLYDLASNSNPMTLDTGTVIHCKHCPSSMILENNTWVWNKKGQAMKMSATPETVKMAKDVLAVQDACNSGGVSNLYHDCVHKLLYKHPDKEGTEWVNANPLAVCILDKLCSLARSQSFDNPYVSKCFTLVHDLAEGRDIEWEVR